MGTRLVLADAKPARGETLVGIDAVVNCGQWAYGGKSSSRAALLVGEAVEIQHFLDVWENHELHSAVSGTSLFRVVVGDRVG